MARWHHLIGQCLLAMLWTLKRCLRGYMELDSLKYLAKALMNYIDGKFEDYFKEIT